MANFTNQANTLLVIAMMALIKPPVLPLKSITETRTEFQGLSLEGDSYPQPDALTHVRTARTIISVRVDWLPRIVPGNCHS